ncbi:UrcA family protein [Marinicauda salina]|nr:UrcA family protein [Marinicauda salina]
MIRQITLTAILATVMSAPALGEPARAGTVDMDFTYQRHELATREGRVRLLARLDRETARFCSGRLHRLGGVAAARDCQARLLDRLVAEIGDRSLARLHRGEPTRLAEGARPDG